MPKSRIGGSFLIRGVGSSPREISIKAETCTVPTGKPVWLVLKELKEG